MKMGHIREVGMLRLGNFCDAVLNSTVCYFEMLFCIEAVVYHGGVFGLSVMQRKGSCEHT